jgi:hypothetical protein
LIETSMHFEARMGGGLQTRRLFRSRLFQEEMAAQELI